MDWIPILSKDGRARDWIDLRGTADWLRCLPASSFNAQGSFGIRISPSDVLAP
jgi:hypothetical protein